MLAVLPQVDDMIDVGSVLLWLGATRRTAARGGGAGRTAAVTSQNRR